MDLNNAMEKVKLLNYICDIETHSLPSAQTAQTKLQVHNWLQTQAERVVLFKDEEGKTTGGLIDLQRKLCSEYLYTGSCHPSEGYCALWHVCKTFIEGNCKGECGRSHSFHDHGNLKNTIEAGLSCFPDQLIRSIVAYSLPQVCLRYSNSANECEINACPYLHICPSVVRKTACGCSLSHNLVDQHNKKILERYKLSNHLFFESEKLTAFVLCNILHPLRQKISKKRKKLKYTLSSNLTSPGSNKTSEFLTSRKSEVSSIPPVPGSLDLQRSNSTSHASTSSPEILTSRASTTSVTKKQTGFLQACPTEVFCSSRSGSSLTSQDSRSFSELSTLQPDSRHCPEPSVRLSSNEVINLEPNNQTSGLSARNLTSQDSTSIPDFHTSKGDDRPETEKRKKMKQEMAFKRLRSPSGLSTTQKYPGVPCISKDDRIPLHWSSEASDANYTRVKVEPGSSEFKEVETLFRKTMQEDKTIERFERVENPFLWEKYSRKKDHMVTLAMQKNPQSVASDIHSEKRLFHGTSPDVVDAICKQNFDWRVCGKKGTKYGKGSYFATNASYSHSYADSDSDGSRFMFLARVLVGSFIKGEPGYQRPPNKDPSNPSSDLYDSCVDSECNPTIFVIFDSDQFYPEYVIKYFTLHQDQILLTPSNFKPRTTKSAEIIKRPISHGALTASTSILQKPVLPHSQGLTANQKRALSHSVENLLQPIEASRSGPSGLTANLVDFSRSPSVNRAVSNSASKLHQPLPAPRNSQVFKASPKSPSTSLSSQRALSYSASSLQQPIALPRGSQGLRPNPKSPSPNLSAIRSLLRSSSNLQEPIKPSTSSKGDADGSSDTFSPSDCNTRSRKKQKNDSKSTKCFIL